MDLGLEIRVGLDLLPDITVDWLGIGLGTVLIKMEKTMGNRNENCNERPRIWAPPKYSIELINTAIGFYNAGFTSKEVSQWTGVSSAYVRKLTSGGFTRKNQ